jgi:hypothetical protein
VNTKKAILLGLAAVAIVVTGFVPPFAQDPSYHHFADRRTLLGISNFWNVMSNLPFLLVGIAGFRVLQSTPFHGGLRELRPLYWTFFIGVSAVAFGSGYYHWAPSNSTLVWDRLPMTIAFMAFFSAIVGERIDVSSGRRLILPLLILGVVSVVYWYYSELRGAGDLRLYALVQFLPMLLLPLILLLYPAKLHPDGYVWGVLVAYALSKLAEYWDGGILSVLGGFSGHSLKHLLAALGTYSFLLALQRRHHSE